MSHGTVMATFTYMVLAFDFCWVAASLSANGPSLVRKTTDGDVSVAINAHGPSQLQMLASAEPKQKRPPMTSAYGYDFAPLIADLFEKASADGALERTLDVVEHGLLSTGKAVGADSHDMFNMSTCQDNTCTLTKMTTQLLLRDYTVDKTCEETPTMQSVVTSEYVKMLLQAHATKTGVPPENVTDKMVNHITSQLTPIPVKMMFSCGSAGAGPAQINTWVPIGAPDADGKYAPIPCDRPPSGELQIPLETSQSFGDSAGACLEATSKITNGTSQEVTVGPDYLRLEWPSNAEFADPTVLPSCFWPQAGPGFDEGLNGTLGLHNLNGKNGVGGVGANGQSSALQQARLSCFTVCALLLHTIFLHTGIC